jgi:hypothetical protein
MQHELYGCHTIDVAVCVAILINLCAFVPLLPPPSSLLSHITLQAMFTSRGYLVSGALSGVYS